jgi:hypothetical protein
MVVKPGTPGESPAPSSPRSTSASSRGSAGRCGGVVLADPQSAEGQPRTSGVTESRRQLAAAVERVVTRSGGDATACGGLNDFVDHFGGSLSTSTFSFEQQKIIR